MNSSASFDQSDLDSLSVKDKQELQQFIAHEQQRAHIQQRTQTCATSLGTLNRD